MEWNKGMRSRRKRVFGEIERRRGFRWDERESVKMEMYDYRRMDVRRTISGIVRGQDSIFIYPYSYI